MVQWRPWCRQELLATACKKQELLIPFASNSPPKVCCNGRQSLHPARAVGRNACETLIGNRLLFTFQLCFWRCVRTSSFLDGLFIPDERASVWGRPLVFITKMFPPPHWSLLTSPNHVDNLIFQKHPPAIPCLALACLALALLLEHLTQLLPSKSFH